MKPVRIWLNRNYATTVHLLNMLRDNPHGVPVELYGSHSDPTSPMLTACDRRLRDPLVTDPDFVDQVLDLCRQHEIDVMLPVAGQSLIAHRADEFQAIGTALICPPAWAIDTLADKEATYSALAGSALVPPWRVARTLAEFDDAVADLADHWTPHRPLIMKPIRGVGADGVRFLTRNGPDLKSLLGPVGPMTAVSVVRQALRVAFDIPPLMVMPYLAGPETSVDVLASRGRTVVAVPRTKSGRQRVIGGDPTLLGLSAELVDHFELDGLINVQFRSFEGRPALLEINSRPSGGLYQTSLTGVNMVWAAVALAVGRDPGELRPRLGTEFVTVSATVPLAPIGAGPLAAFAAAEPVLAGRVGHPV